MRGYWRLPWSQQVAPRRSASSRESLPSLDADGLPAGLVVDHKLPSTLRSGGTTFRGTIFDCISASFSRPQVWNQVMSDWDDDLSLKPSMVEPERWPPAVQTFAGD